MTDCAIITALPKENDAVLFHFRGWKTLTPPDSTRTFYETTAPNGLRVVAATTVAMGSVHAATLAADLLAIYKPKSLILVGIAGGMDRDISLGDVVASEQIVGYDTGKITREGFGPRWSVYRTDDRLLNMIRNWQSQDWQSYIRTPRPDGKPAAESKLCTGLYLSGNKVITDEKTAGVLKSVWHKAAAIEMEAEGVAAAIQASASPPGFLVIKAICDYADSSKNDSWQAYAAEAAASCALSFIIHQLRPSNFSPLSTFEKPVSVESGYNLEDLRQTIHRVFDLEELETACLALGVGWEDIRGATLTAKVTSLLKYLERRRKLQALIDYVNSERDNILKAFSPHPTGPETSTYP